MVERSRAFQLPADEVFRRLGVAFRDNGYQVRTADAPGGRYVVSREKKAILRVDNHAKAVEVVVRSQGPERSVVLVKLEPWPFLSAAQDRLTARELAWAFALVEDCLAPPVARLGWPGSSSPGSGMLPAGVSPRRSPSPDLNPRQRLERPLSLTTRLREQRRRVSAPAFRPSATCGETGCAQPAQPDVTASSPLNSANPKSS